MIPSTTKEANFNQISIRVQALQEILPQVKNQKRIITILHRMNKIILVVTQRMIRINLKRSITASWKTSSTTSYQLLKTAIKLAVSKVQTNILPPKRPDDGRRRNMRNLKRDCNFLVETGNESKSTLEHEQVLRFARMHKNSTIGLRKNKQIIMELPINQGNSQTL